MPATAATAAAVTAAGNANPNGPAFTLVGAIAVEAEAASDDGLAPTAADVSTAAALTAPPDATATTTTTTTTGAPAPVADPPSPAASAQVPPPQPGAIDVAPPAESADWAEVPDPSIAAPVSRVRLVLEHDHERVVVSVALRHGTVDVAIRTGNVDLATAVARSLDELDTALRGHGLALGDLAAGDQRAPQPAPPRPRAAGALLVRDDDPGVQVPEGASLVDPRLRARA